MKVLVQTKLSLGRTWPSFAFCPVAELISTIDIDSHTRRELYAVDIDANQLQLSNLNKHERDTIVENGVIVHDQILSIEKIWIDNILIDLNIVLPFISYTPHYHQGYLDYCKNNNVDAANTINTYDLHFNGIWQFEFELPFWSWYHQLRLMDLTRGLNQSQIERYIGQFDTETKQMLIALKEYVK
jgi:hypothetical protein